MKILFAGGGTAGHINPALAIANYVREKDSNCEILFVGTENGLEMSLVPRADYTIKTITIHGFERKLSFGTVKTALEIPKAILDSKKIIKKFKPDIVVGTGGYVCGPVLYAAAKMGIPTLIHESNAYAGITTKILAGYVDTVAIGIEAAIDRIQKAKNIVVTGNPIRTSILTKDSFEARRALRLDERPFIIIFGGSLGARDFNTAVAQWICSVAKDGKYQILMGTGKLNQYERVMDIFAQNGINTEKLDGISIREYIYDMDVAMNAADLVISRAGASTLAELTAIGKPAILVPSPYVTDNHQEHNARAIEKGGGAMVITENELNVIAINMAVESILKDRGRISVMQKASAKMGVPNATERIYNEILKLI